MYNIAVLPKIRGKRKKKIQYFLKASKEALVQAFFSFHSMSQRKNC
jgi:hypothetical protein